MMKHGYTSEDEQPNRDISHEFRGHGVSEAWVRQRVRNGLKQRVKQGYSHEPLIARDTYQKKGGKFDQGGSRAKALSTNHRHAGVVAHEASKLIKGSAKKADAKERGAQKKAIRRVNKPVLRRGWED
jgi:hypothetical protein